MFFFCNIFHKQQFWWNLVKIGQYRQNSVHRSLNKFAAKWCKYFPPHLSMSLHYLLKLQMVTRHVLPLSCNLLCPNSIRSTLLKTFLKPGFQLGFRHVLSRLQTCRWQVRDHKSRTCHRSDRFVSTCLAGLRCVRDFFVERFWVLNKIEAVEYRKRQVHRGCGSQPIGNQLTMT